MKIIFFIRKTQDTVFHSTDLFFFFFLIFNSKLTREGRIDTCLEPRGICIAAIDRYPIEQHQSYFLLPVTLCWQPVAPLKLSEQQQQQQQQPLNFVDFDRCMMRRRQ